jgi:hypothetical protein
MVLEKREKYPSLNMVFAMHSAHVHTHILHLVSTELIYFIDRTRVFLYLVTQDE